MGRQKRKLLPALLSILLIAGNAGEVSAAMEWAANFGVWSQSEPGSQTRADARLTEIEVSAPEELEEEIQEEEYTEEEAPEEELTEEETPEEKFTADEYTEAIEENESSGSAHQHDSACGYREAQEEIPCGHNCTDIDNDGIIDHCKECAYRPAVEESPCRYEIEAEAGKEAEEKEDQSSQPEDPRDNQMEDELKKEESAAGDDIRQEGEKEGKSEDKKEAGDKAKPGNAAEAGGEIKPGDAAETGDEIKPEKIAETGDEIKPEKIAETENEVKPGNTAEPADEIKPGNTAEQGNEIKPEDSENTGQAQEMEQPDMEGTEDISADGLWESQSNEPVYEVEIPSQVILADNLNSFDIKTKRLNQEETGKLLVTIEGTESPDGENFALYCGDESWEYQLEMAGDILTPKENRAILNPLNDVQNIMIIPQTTQSLQAGTYTGALMFHVAYEINEEK